MTRETLKLLLIGATGVVGRHALAIALDDPRVGAVIAPTRRPLPARPGLENPLVDFADLPSDAPWWSVDGVISTLGTTQRIAGSPEAFRKVDHGYTLAVARIARAAGATRFALTSSLGADPASRSFYLRTKGEIERDLAALGFPSLTFVRPGLLGGSRPGHRPAEDAGKALLGLLGPLLPARFRISDPERVGRALVDAFAVGRPGCQVISSDRLA